MGIPSIMATPGNVPLLPDSSGVSICAALERLHDESVQFWNAFDTATFFAPLGEAWSPAENIRHLTKSMRAVASGLNVPRIVLLLAFRRARRPSRTYDEVRESYLARLALGADAGRFAPGPRPVGLDAEAERAQIMSYHATAVKDLCNCVRRWPERALDRRQLPHPLLGRMTVREMLYFTLYHNRHHVDNVRRKLPLVSASA